MYETKYLKIHADVNDPEKGLYWQSIGKEENFGKKTNEKAEKIDQSTNKIATCLIWMTIVASPLMHILHCLIVIAWLIEG